jgi:hypothetical protein
MKTEKVLQQPHAANAMNRRNAESDPAAGAIRQIGTAPANGSRNPSVRQAVVRLDQSLVQRAIHATNHIDPKCFLLFSKQDASKSVPPGVEKICAYIVKGPTFFG